MALGGAEGETTLTYRYTADGQRTYKKPEGSEATRYVRDGSATVAVVEGGSLKHWNVTLPGGEVIGRVGSGGSSRRYYLKDHLGSIRVVLDGGGGVRETRDYYPFGLPMPGRYEKGSPPTQEDFTGYEKDESTGLHYAGARYYASAFGRFTTTDRFADKYPSLSPYHYTKNNPATLVDVNGDTVRAETEEEQEVILNTLPEGVRDNVEFNEDGVLKTDLLNEADADSGNLESLKQLANDENMHVVEVAGNFMYKGEDGNIKEMTLGKIRVDKNLEAGPYSPTTGETGYLGQTLTPKGSGPLNSPDGNVHIIINEGLSKLGRAQLMAHEGYGHAYMYSKGLPSGHRVESVNGEMVDTNRRLLEWVKQRIKEVSNVN
jgi:RHS repeat-associated protein